MGASKPRRTPRRRAWDWWLPWTGLLLGIVLRLSHQSVPQRSPDEMYYAMYSRMVVEHGPGYIPRFVHSINQSPDPEFFSWPQRVGYILLLAGAMIVTGLTTVDVVAAVSLVASILTLGLVLWWGRAAFDPWTTTIAMWFVATSPLDLAIARRGWQDGVLALLVITMAFACARSAMDPRQWRWPALFLSAGIVALLTKESASPVYMAGTVYLAVAARGGSGHRADGVPRPADRLLLGGLGFGVAIAAVMLACGGPHEALATWKTFGLSGAPNVRVR